MPRQASKWLSKSIAYIKEDKPRKAPFLVAFTTWKSDPKMQIPQRADPIGGKHKCREIELPGLALNIWAWFLTEQGLEPALEH